MKQQKTHKPEVKKTPEKAKGASSPSGESPVKWMTRQTQLWVVLGLTFLLTFFIFHQYLTGSLLYLFKDIGSDTLNTFYPHFAYINRYLRTEGIPLWAFAHGLGQNIQSISINDPFYFFIYLAGADSVAYAIIWMEVAKILVTAFLVYLFLKSIGLSPQSILIGTLLYSFSGFMIVGGGWYIFSTEACFLAFLLYAFEIMYQKGRWYFFPVAIALIAVNQPFNLFLYGTFLILYFLVRHYTAGWSWRKTGITVLQISGFGLLGLLMSSFFFWSSMQALLDSPRVGGSSGYFKQLMSAPLFGLGDSLHNTTAVLRFFSNDMLGHGTDYRGWQNYLEAPLFYIGLFPLLLMPQVFLLSGRKKALAYGALLTVLLLPVIFPYLRYATWLFTGDYYRGFSFFVGLAILYLALQAFDLIIQKGKVNLIVLGITFALLMVLLYFPYPSGSTLIDEGSRSTARNFLVLYAIITGLFQIKTVRPVFGYVVIALVVIELGYTNYVNLSKRDAVTSRELKSKTGYNDFAVEGAAYINEQDKSFFRAEKNYTCNPAVHTSFNDAKIQGYNGSMVYGSFNQKSYIRFMEEMDIITPGNEMESRWVVGLGSRPILMSLVNTKYSMVKGNSDNFQMMGYRKIAEFEDIQVMKNQYYLPFGFAYDSYVSIDSIRVAGTLTKDRIMMRAFVAESPIDPRFSVLKRYEMRDTLVPYSYGGYYEDANLLRDDTLAVTYFSQNRITGRITLEKPQLLYLSIPYDDGWRAMVDGKFEKPILCNVGFTGFLLDAGKHEIEVVYRPPYFNLSIWLSIAGLILFGGLVYLDTSGNVKRQRHAGN
jgi:uncharacterized membrane protein YfhO